MKSFRVLANELSAAENLVAAVTTEVGKRFVIEDPGGGIANIQQQTEQRTMLGVVVNAPAERLGVLKGRQGAVDPANHFPERDFLRRALQLVAALSATQAADDARAREVQKKGFPQLLR